MFFGGVKKTHRGGSGMNIKPEALIKYLSSHDKGWQI